MDLGSNMVHGVTFLVCERLFCLLVWFVLV